MISLGGWHALIRTFLLFRLVTLIGMLMRTITNSTNNHFEIVKTTCKHMKTFRLDIMLQPINVYPPIRNIKHSRNRIGQRRIQNPVKHLKWSVLQKIVNGFQLLTIFAKHSILDV